MVSRNVPTKHWKHTSASTARTSRMIGLIISHLPNFHSTMLRMFPLNKPHSLPTLVTIPTSPPYFQNVLPTLLLLNLQRDLILFMPNYARSLLMLTSIWPSIITNIISPPPSSKSDPLYGSQLIWLTYCETYGLLP